jgi:dihydroflavonol-4-reductase
VKRVVLTSSFAAIGYGQPELSRPFNESDWTNPANSRLSAYVKSKTIAERAAWDFIAKEGGGLELAVINPVGVMGPVLGADFSTSIAFVKRMLDGMPGCPKLYFGIVDVRDVADHHIRAMTNPAARGERFLSVSGNFVRLIEIATMLRRRLGDAASRVPTRELPNFVVRLAGLRDSGVRQFVPELGKKRNATNEKSRRLLGWSPRSPEDAVIATAESLLQLGLVAQ